MSTRRLLGDTLVEIASGTLDALAAAPGLRVRSVSVTLPLELELSRTGDRTDIRGDVPRAVTRTAFDIEPGRLMVVWEEGEQS
jgi:hypothetical protein